MSSPRREELLDRAYSYVLDHGLVSLSLRPLAAAIGSSPRVLLFLFESKEGLVRALLERARADEMELLRASRGDSIGAVAAATWSWLAAAEHRPFLKLWVEGYGRSLVEPDGPWAGFAEATVDDWLRVLAAAQPPALRRTAAGRAERTQVLALLRGAMLDLLATGDAKRVTVAVRQGLTGVLRAGNGQHSGR
jgi:AcrR family transcriptional regulator